MWPSQFLCRLLIIPISDLFSSTILSISSLVLCSIQLILSILPDLLSRPLKKAQDQDLGPQVSRPRPRPWPPGLETKTKTLATRSRDQDLGHQVSRPRPRPW